ncbi:MAG: L-threonylcarbamoyladenylate synthase [Planctomycetota bacterium]|nr:L-threonylcarbamoyladenylate synthase [Planctomycetota bacterium]
MKENRNILPAASRSIARAARLIRAGGLVAFPTETVYGLGANAFDAAAVARIFEAKGRPRFNPLIVHVSSLRDALRLWRRVPARMRRLMDSFWPGPLALVLPKSTRVPDIVTAGLDSVAVRMPDHPVALDLLRRCGCPVAAPSANRFGRPSPTCARDVLLELGERVDMILDGGPSPIGLESTVVSFIDGEPVVMRAGSTTVEALEKTLRRRIGVMPGPARPGDRKKTSAAAPAGSTPGLRSPGIMEGHCARGGKPLFILTRRRRPTGRGGHSAVFPLSRSALLTLRPVPDARRFAFVEILSPMGDLVEAATRLFASIRRLEATDVDCMLARPVARRGLGLAIMDRLERAAAGRAWIDETSRSVIVVGDSEPFSVQP